MIKPIDKVKVLLSNSFETVSVYNHTYKIMIENYMKSGNSELNYQGEKKSAS